MKHIVLLSTLIFMCYGYLTAQRTTKGFYDQQENAHGNIALKSTNYGVFGRDMITGQGANFWKRGTANQYIYGGGMWFGAKKTVKNLPNRKLVSMSYNPSTGSSWMSPTVDPNCKNLQDSIKYSHLYFSTDFDKSGNPLTIPDSFGSYKWPIFKSFSTNNFGEYISDLTIRTTTNLSPHFVSDEDIISMYNDSDLSRYDFGDSLWRVNGHPLGINIVQRTYFFDQSPLNDVFIVRYEVTHTGNDTLNQCWVAPVLDFDIGYIDGSNTSNSYALDDNLKHYSLDSSLGLMIGWSKTLASDKGKKIGYLGATFLETPKTDTLGNLTLQGTELGLRTQRNWHYENDPLQNDSARYDFMSKGRIDAETTPSEMRLLMATGPFTMRPGETTVISFAIMYAATTSGGDATGSNADVAKLVQLCRDTKAAYSNFAKGGAFTAVHEDIQENIHSLYPNPTTGVTTVEYAVNSPSMVTVEVFDMLSNRVAVLENASRAPGTYRTSFDTQALPAGVYYFRIDTGGVITLKKLIVVK